MRTSSSMQLPTPLLTLLVGVVATALVGALTDKGWAGYVVGAVYALSLWLMIFVGATSVAGRLERGVSPTTYALAAAIAVVLGYVLFRTVGDGDNATWWAPAFIIAGVTLPHGMGARSRASD